jgi:hypothetical protein
LKDGGKLLIPFQTLWRRELGSTPGRRLKTAAAVAEVTLRKAARDLDP